MLGHHVIDAYALRVGLFAGFCKEDHIPIQYRPGSLQPEEAHERGCQDGLIIHRATSPDVTIFDDGGKGVDRPFFTLHRHHIGMRQNQEWFL